MQRDLVWQPYGLNQGRKHLTVRLSGAAVGQSARIADLTLTAALTNHADCGEQP
jgi:hypothetical protein